MGVFDRFERRLERLVEGAFGRVFKGEAVPADIRDCGRILYEAFASLASDHGFPPDFPCLLYTSPSPRD